MVAIDDLLIYLCVELGCYNHKILRGRAALVYFLVLHHKKSSGLFLKRTSWDYVNGPTSAEAWHDVFLLAEAGQQHPSPLAGQTLRMPGAV